MVSKNGLQPNILQDNIFKLSDYSDIFVSQHNSKTTKFYLVQIWLVSNVYSIKFALTKSTEHFVMRNLNIAITWANISIFQGTNAVKYLKDTFQICKSKL